MPKGSWREFHDFASKTTHDDLINVQSKAELPVRVGRTRGGKRGKTVTVISGLGINTNELRTFLKKLKTSCGTGGTLKGDSLELQGDQVDLAIALLKQEGYFPKKSGG